MERARPRERPGGRTFRCGILFWQHLKAGCWFRKQLCCMHWHGQVVRSVVLALISAGTLIMTQTHRFVCVACEERAGGTFTTACPTLRGAKTHIGKSLPCRAADLGVREIALEIRQTDTMVGGSDAAGQAPDLRHQPPGSAWQCSKKQE